MRGLDNVANLKLEALRKSDHTMATHNTIIWLPKNQHRFKEEIIEPAAVSATVTDKNFASAIESCLNRDVLLVSPPPPSSSIHTQITDYDHRRSYPKTT